MHPYHLPWHQIVQFFQINASSLPPTMISQLNSKEKELSLEIEDNISVLVTKMIRME